MLLWRERLGRNTFFVLLILGFTKLLCYSSRPIWICNENKGCASSRVVVWNIYIYFEGRRRLTSLVYLDGILSVNIATVTAVRSFFFKGWANGCGKSFYDEELPLPTLCCFFCCILFIKVLILVVEIWGHALDNAIYSVSVKLFSSIQIPIFLACTAFDFYFLCSVDASFLEGILL